MLKTKLDNNVLVCSGLLISSNIQSVHASGQRLLDQSSAEVFVDLSRTDDVLDLAGIQFLAVLFRSAKRRGKRLRILGIQETQQNAIDVAGFQFLTDDQSW